MLVFGSFNFLLICAPLIGLAHGAPTNENLVENVLNYDKETQLNKVDEQDLEKLSFDSDRLPEDNARHITTELIPLCHSVKRIVYPKKILAKNVEWFNILQTTDHRQGVLEERCMNANGTCEFSEYFPRGYVAKCIQSYVERPLIAIVNGTLIRKHFRIGSGCNCMLERKF